MKKRTVLIHTAKYKNLMNKYTRASTDANELCPMPYLEDGIIGVWKAKEARLGEGDCGEEGGGRYLGLSSKGGHLTAPDPSTCRQVPKPGLHGAGHLPWVVGATHVAWRPRKGHQCGTEGTKGHVQCNKSIFLSCITLTIIHLLIPCLDHHSFFHPSHLAPNTTISIQIFYSSS